MTTHGLLTEHSLSPHVVTHDRKGREGKGREEEGKPFQDQVDNLTGGSLGVFGFGQSR